MLSSGVSNVLCRLKVTTHTNNPSRHVIVTHSKAKSIFLILLLNRSTSDTITLFKGRISNENVRKASMLSNLPFNYLCVLVYRELRFVPLVKTNNETIVVNSEPQD